MSDATKDTLTDNVKAMSAGWDKCKTHIYNILDETSADPFPPFLSMYAGALRSGITTTHWDAELEYAREKNLRRMNAPELAASFSAKLKEQNRTIERYVDAVSDGEWTEAEIDEVENLLIAERDAIGQALHGLKLKRERLTESRRPHPNYPRGM